MHCPNEYWERLQNGKPFAPNEEMQFEALRLASFVNWPLWAQKRPGKLSEKGFYYSGEDDRVICHSCKAALSKWRVSDDIDDRHKAVSPACSVVVNPVSDSKLNKSGSQDNITDLTEVTNFITEKLTGVGKVDGLDTAGQLLEGLQSLTFSGASRLVPSALAGQEQGTEPIEQVNLSLVKYESYRLRTFTGKWPVDSFMAPAELAKAGFYFMSHPDHVKCAFCDGELFNWKPSDCPMTEHTTHFPRCGFVKGRNVGNITAEECQDPHKNPSKTNKNKGSPSTKFGIMTDRPKHPEFAIESARLETFKIWPKKDTISPEDLAKAGFFYIGNSDNVKCFFCDGGLRNWDAGDDAMTEHARWFSRCGYIKLQVGEEVINRILSETEGKGNSRSTRLQRPKHEVPDTTDDRRVETLVMMGFEVKMIKRVIRNHIETTGNDFSDIDDLVEALWEEQQKNTNNHTGAISNEHKPGETVIGNRENIKTVSKQPVSGGSPQRSKTNKEVTTPSKNDSTTATENDEEVQSLMRQYQRIQDERTCKVCMDDECTVVFLPCGHLVCCANCAPALRNCPICRTLIRGSVRISKEFL